MTSRPGADRLVIDKLIEYLKSIQKPKRAPEPAGSAQPPESDSVGGTGA
jgi:hypothetical protein